jgi:hypothetical protein
MGVQIFFPVGKMHLSTINLFLRGRDSSGGLSLLVLSKCRYSSPFPSKSIPRSLYKLLEDTQYSYLRLQHVPAYAFHLFSHANAKVAARTIYVLIFSIAYPVSWPVPFTLFIDNLLKSSDTWCIPILRAHIFHVLSSQFCTHAIAHKELFAHSLRRQLREISWLNDLAYNVRNKYYAA